MRVRGAVEVEKAGARLEVTARTDAPRRPLPAPLDRRRHRRVLGRARREGPRTLRTKGRLSVTVRGRVDAARRQEADADREDNVDPRLASDGVLRRLVLLLAAGLVLSACGETPRPATQPRVTLKLSAPDDGGSTREDRVEIHGTVSPGDASRPRRRPGRAGQRRRVHRRGGAAAGRQRDRRRRHRARPAPGDRGRARRARHARARPRRRRPGPRQGHRARSRRPGWTPVEERGGSWIDRLLPGDVQVCTMTPQGETLVEKGTRVVIQTAREC